MLTVFALLVWLIVGVWCQQVDYSGYQVLRLTLTHPKQLAEIEQLVHDVWSCHLPARTIDVCASPEEREALQKAGYQWTVLIEDVGELIQSQQSEYAPSSGLFERYLTLEEVYSAMALLADQNPRLVQMIQVGRSVEGRPIYALRITKDPRLARVYRNRPQVVFNGCQHAREWISVSVPLYLAFRLVSSYGVDSRITELLNRLEVYVIPVVNPDGYVYSWTTDRLWRKNRRYLGQIGGRRIYGVDLNRNWGYRWGGQGSSSDPTSETYRGPSPFSEPETYLLSRWLLSLPTLRAHIDIHSYSQLILWPWGYTTTLPPHNALFRSIGQAMQTRIRSVYGQTYQIGNIATTLYPGGGNMVDWVFGVRGALSYAIELRDRGQYGFLLPPNQILPNSEEVFPAILGLMEWALSRRWD